MLALLLPVLALLLPVLAPATAAADADPASDILLGANVFYPYSTTISRPLVVALDRETTQAQRAGFPLKVAIIGHAFDLGGVPEFFGRPKPYAKFLDTEISFNGLQHVLVVMPAGIGGYGLPPTAKATLATLPKPQTLQPDALAQAAITDVAKLATAAGHPLGAPPAAAGQTNSGPTLAIIAVAAVLTVALTIVFLKRRGPPGAQDI
ncbi:MAG TPA: hypothetical protein VG186_16285 [Solirubrobacteraceae bacterium]|nr:hypothetical protein [Solirubrobacteraceae bacterium]